MTSTLILGWDKQRVLAVAGSASGDVVRVSHCVEFEWPQTFTPQNSPAEAGKYLRKQLDSAGIDITSAVISVPREEVVIRYLELPQVPDDEVPEMVRLQAATKSAFPVDQLLIDFLPLPSFQNAEMRRVLLATMPKSQSESIRKTLEAAQIELRGIRLGSVGLAELGSRLATPPYGQSLLVINLASGRLELALVQDGHLLATHSAFLANQSAFLESDNLTVAAIQAEINRMLIAAENKLGELHPGAYVALAGPGESQLLEGLRTRYDDNLTIVDPLASSVVQFPRAVSSDNAAHWSGPLGVLLSIEAGRVHGVDFLAPRKAIPKKDMRPFKYAAIGGGVLAFVVLISYLFMNHLSNLEQQVADLKDRQTELKADLKLGTADIEAGKQLKEWLARDLHLVAEIDRFQQDLPGTDQALLTQFRFDVNNSKLIAEYRAEGIATDRQVVEEAQRRFAQRGLKVPAQPFGTSRKESGYPVSFEFDMDLPAVDPAGTKPNTVKK